MFVDSIMEVQPTPKKVDQMIADGQQFGVGIWISLKNWLDNPSPMLNWGVSMGFWLHTSLGTSLPSSKRLHNYGKIAIL